MGGTKDWFWNWQNHKLTYITHSDNRGSATIIREFPRDFPKSVLIRDGWRAQAGTPAVYHQFYSVHLLRRLNYLNEKYKIGRAGTIQKMERLLEHPPDKKQKSSIFYTNKTWTGKTFLPPAS